MAEAKANLDEAKKKLEAARKEYETRQKQLTSLREKMRNVQDPVKKARYNTAYDMLKAEFECAKAKFRAAEGEVLKLQKKIKLLEAEQANNGEKANKNSTTKLIPTDGGMLSALCMLGVMFLLVSRLIIRVNPKEQGNG